VHLGVGANAGGKGARARLTIAWPSGQTTVHPDIALDARHAVAAPACADVDGDGTVSASDVSAVLAAWGATDRAQRAMRAADVQADGVVDARDVTAVLAQWGR
jgi:hypothetical protein